MSVSWSELVDELGADLYRYFCSQRLDEAEAADCVQETLTRVYLAVEDGKYESSFGSLRQYAYGFARLVKLETQRKRRKLQYHPTLTDYDFRIIDPAPGVAQHDAELLRRAIADLGPPMSEILGLLIDKDLSLQEIAELMDIPVGTIKSHIHRSKEKLKESLDELRP